VHLVEAKEFFIALPRGSLALSKTLLRTGVYILWPSGCVDFLAINDIRFE
jgi:hypothetical protein